MNFNRIYAIFLRQIYLLKNNPTRFVTIFLWIVIDVILWGFLTRYFGALGQLSVASALFGAVILLGFLTRAQQGTMLAFFEDVWSQNFINYFSSPLRIGEYITGLVATSILTTSLGFLLTTSLAGIAFGYNVFKLGLSILPFLVILFIFGTALGIFAAAVVLRLGPAGEWIGWPIVALVSPLAGVLYPVTVLPRALQYLSRLIPASYVFESMRSILISHTALSQLVEPLLIGFLVSIAYLAAMYLFFLHNYRIVVKKGAIGRFSAESA